MIKVAKKIKQKNYLVGTCNYCDKSLYSDYGNWIINAEKMHFCHGIYDCFDKYLKLCKEMAHKNTWMANLYKGWKNRTPFNKHYGSEFLSQQPQVNSENKIMSDTKQPQAKRKVPSAADFLAGMTRLEPSVKTTKG